MRAVVTFAAASAAIIQSCACIGLHLAGTKPLQIHPSFGENKVTLFPAHAPGHDIEDIGHLIPQLQHSLYYSQEGHRPALHGSKHATFEVNYVRPTVMLDHAGHVEQITCEDKNVNVCFYSDEAADTAREAWKDGDFTLGTYHVGCGDETTGKRSYYHVAEAPSQSDRRCLVMTAAPIDDHEAFYSGEISWGTYTDPAYRKRAPAMGHVYMVDNNEEVDAANSDTADISGDLRARKKFFYDKNLKSKPGDKTVKEFEFVSEDGTVAKRGDVMFQGLFDSIVALFNLVESYLTAYAKAVSVLANAIGQIGIIAAKAVGAVFGVPFDHSYREDFSFDFYLKPVGILGKPPAIFDLEPGFMIQYIGPGSALQCAKCGITGDFSVSGRLAFTISGGITKGEVALENNKPFRIDAQFGLTVAQALGDGISVAKKQLGAFPLTPLSIPGVIALGPQATISTALELEMEGEGSILLGGYFQLNKGKATLDVVNSSNTKIEGLEPKFHPVFNITNSVTATAQFAVPVAIEVALDLFNGRYKRGVSYVNKPSIYAKAVIPTNPTESCNNGVQLRAGVRNQLYYSPRKGLTGPDVANVVLYEKGTGCVTATGFNPNDVSPDESIFGEIAKQFGQDIADTTEPGYVDDSRALAIAESKVGFRLIMDDDKSSILVTGKDGFIYLAKTDQKYDFSSPWGSVKKGSNIVDLDVLGRIASYQFSTKSVVAAQIRMYKPSKVPRRWHASGLVIVKNSKSRHYAVMLKSSEVSKLFYPTFCNTNAGFRLFATQEPFNSKGQVNVKNQKTSDQIVKGLKGLGVTNTGSCRTVQLSGSS